MATANASSIKSMETNPADNSRIPANIERRLWVLHSQLKATNALVQAESTYDQSDSLASVSFLLTEMEDNADQLIDLMNEVGLSHSHAMNAENAEAANG